MLIAPATMPPLVVSKMSRDATLRPTRRPGWRWNILDDPGVYRVQFLSIRKQEDRMKTRSVTLFCTLLPASIKIRSTSLPRQ